MSLSHPTTPPATDNLSLHDALPICTGLNDATLADDPSAVVTVNGPTNPSTGTCTTSAVAVCDTRNAPALPVKSTDRTPPKPGSRLGTVAPAAFDPSQNDVICT